MKSYKKGIYPINNRNKENKIESFLGLGSGILEAGPLVAGANPEKIIKTENLEENAHLDIGIISFLSWIGLYIVCFVFLFQSKTEYLAWIFAVIVKFLFPITWIMDVMEYPMSNYKGYMLGCIVVGFVLELVALIITLITNSITQSRLKDYQNKKDNKDDREGEKQRTIYDELNNFFSGLLAEIISFPYWLASYLRGSNNTSGKFSNKDFYVNDRIGFFNEIIKKLFTTTAVLLIAVVTNYFVDEVNIEQDRKENPHSEMGSNIHWWISLIPVKLEQFDIFWQKMIAAIGIDPFFKFFCLFCIGFCAFFFGIFIRLIPTYSKFGVNYVERQTNRDNYCTNNPNDKKCKDKKGKTYTSAVFNNPDVTGYINKSFRKDIDDNKEEAVHAKFLEKNGLEGYILHLKYDVVNMPKIYNNEWGPINLPGLVGFFMSMAVIIIWCFLYYILSINLDFSIVDLILFNGKTELYTLGSYFFYIMCVVLFLITFLGCFFTLNNNVFDSNNGHSTDSVVMFLLSFFFALVGTPVVALCYEFIARLIKAFQPKMPIISELLDNNFYKYVFYAFIALSFLALLFGTYGAGVDKKNGNWLYNQGANKSIRAFVAAIISIIFGWFTAFSSYFKMFSFLLNVISFPIRNIVFALGPITILALSITQLALAEKVKKVPGKVVGK